LLQQIYTDMNNANPRLQESDREMISKLMTKHDANTVEGKRAIVESVVENSRVYFSKLFTIEVRLNVLVLFLRQSNYVYKVTFIIF